MAKCGKSLNGCTAWEIVVSTQIGSIAYIFSLGGPVVDLYLESILIVPIVPSRFGWRHYMLKGERSVELKLEKVWL